MVAPKCWSRDYFTKNNETGNFECDFCNASCADTTTKFKHHSIPEHPALFKVGRQGAEAREDEIFNRVEADDIVIENC
jgi:hypothetical protein